MSSFFLNNCTLYFYLCVGRMNGYYESDTIEILDPVTMTWRFGPKLNVGRFRHTSTVLPDGTVMHVGGGSDRSCEICNLVTSTCTLVSERHCEHLFYCLISIFDCNRLRRLVNAGIAIRQSCWLLIVCL